MLSFIKGAFKIRMCYQIYEYCESLMEKMDQSDLNKHFIGGVLFGCGCFNVVGILKNLCHQLKLPKNGLNLILVQGFDICDERHREIKVLRYSNKKSDSKASLL